jgi:hypothetical protein
VGVCAIGNCTEVEQDVTNCTRREKCTYYVVVRPQVLDDGARGGGTTHHRGWSLVPVSQATSAKKRGASTTPPLTAEKRHSSIPVLQERYLVLTPGLSSTTIDEILFGFE